MLGCWETQSIGMLQKHVNYYGYVMTFSKPIKLLLSRSNKNIVK